MTYAAKSLQLDAHVQTPRLHSGYGTDLVQLCLRYHHMFQTRVDAVTTIELYCLFFLDLLPGF